AELYDLSTGTWTFTGSMNNAAFFYAASVLTNGKVLVTGGWGSTGMQNSAELYDPLTGTWTAIGTMNNERQTHTASVLTNGKVLVTGGSSSIVLQSSELY
ncbi:unnamed protein product, partial [Rotaria sp. Silwood2]